MQVLTLTAHFDGKHIQLDEPFALPAGACLVTLIPDFKAGTGLKEGCTALEFTQNRARSANDTTADAWDQQIEKNVESGKLDVFYQRLQQENAGQPDIPLHEFLNKK